MGSYYRNNRLKEECTLLQKSERQRSLNTLTNLAPARSVEGWIIIISGIHEEAQDEDIQEIFSEFGNIKNLHLNLDRRNGFAKGYALLEYPFKKNAERALDEMNGKDFLGQKIKVDWAFSKTPLNN